jgi:hypothetical protein
MPLPPLFMRGTQSELFDYTTPGEPGQVNIFGVRLQNKLQIQTHQIVTLLWALTRMVVYDRDAALAEEAMNSNAKLLKHPGLPGGLWSLPMGGGKTLTSYIFMFLATQPPSDADRPIPPHLQGIRSIVDEAQGRTGADRVNFLRMQTHVHMHSLMSTFVELQKALHRRQSHYRHFFDSYDRLVELHNARKEIQMRYNSASQAERNKLRDFRDPEFAFHHGVVERVLIDRQREGMTLTHLVDACSAQIRRVERDRDIELKYYQEYFNHVVGLEGRLHVLAEEMAVRLLPFFYEALRSPMLDTNGSRVLANPDTVALQTHRPCVVFCDRTLIRNWIDEAFKFFGYRMQILVIVSKRDLQCGKGQENFVRVVHRTKFRATDLIGRHVVITNVEAWSHFHHNQDNTTASSRSIRNIRAAIRSKRATVAGATAADLDKIVTPVQRALYMRELQRLYRIRRYATLQEVEHHMDGLDRQTERVFGVAATPPNPDEKYSLQMHAAPLPVANHKSNAKVMYSPSDIAYIEFFNTTFQWLIIDEAHFKGLRSETSMAAVIKDISAVGRVALTATAVTKSELDLQRQLALIGFESRNFMLQRACVSSTSQAVYNTISEDVKEFLRLNMHKFVFQMSQEAFRTSILPVDCIPHRLELNGTISNDPKLLPPSDFTHDAFRRHTYSHDRQLHPTDPRMVDMLHNVYLRTMRFLRYDMECNRHVKHAQFSVFPLTASPNIPNYFRRSLIHSNNEDEPQQKRPHRMLQTSAPIIGSSAIAATHMPDSDSESDDAVMPSVVEVPATTSVSPTSSSESDIDADLIRLPDGSLAIAVNASDEEKEAAEDTNDPRDESLLSDIDSETDENDADDEMEDTGEPTPSPPPTSSSSSSSSSLSRPRAQPQPTVTAPRGRKRGRPNATSTTQSSTSSNTPATEDDRKNARAILSEFTELRVAAENQYAPFNLKTIQGITQDTDLRCVRYLWSLLTEAPHLAAQGGLGYLHDRFTAYVDYMHATFDEDDRAFEVAWTKHYQTLRQQNGFVTREPPLQKRLDWIDAFMDPNGGPAPPASKSLPFCTSRATIVAFRQRLDAELYRRDMIRIQQALGQQRHGEMQRAFQETIVALETNPDDEAALDRYVETFGELVFVIKSIGGLHMTSVLHPLLDIGSTIKNMASTREVRILGCSYRIGGTGINAQFADSVGLLDIPHSFRDDLQAQSRVHRPGQTRNVMQIFITRDFPYERLRKEINEFKFQESREILLTTSKAPARNYYIEATQWVKGRSSQQQQQQQQQLQGQNASSAQPARPSTAALSGVRTHHVSIVKSAKDMDSDEEEWNKSNAEASSTSLKDRLAQNDRIVRIDRTVQPMVHSDVVSIERARRWTCMVVPWRPAPSNRTRDVMEYYPLTRLFIRSGTPSSASSSAASSMNRTFGRSSMGGMFGSGATDTRDKLFTLFYYFFIDAEAPPVARDALLKFVRFYYADMTDYIVDQINDQRRSMREVLQQSLSCVKGSMVHTLFATPDGFATRYLSLAVVSIDKSVKQSADRRIIAATYGRARPLEGIAQPQPYSSRPLPMSSANERLPEIRWQEPEMFAQHSSQMNVSAAVQAGTAFVSSATAIAQSSLPMLSTYSIQDGPYIVLTTRSEAALRILKDTSAMTPLRPYLYKLAQTPTGSEIPIRNDSLFNSTQTTKQFQKLLRATNHTQDEFQKCMQQHPADAVMSNSLWIVIRKS